MSDPDPSLPGVAVDVPLPPQLAETFGYPGQARYVSFHWIPEGDEVLYDDGRMSGTGASWAFLSYRRHRAVEPLLTSWNLGYSDVDAEHCLIIDRAAGRASVAPLAKAQPFLLAQHPPPPPLTPEQRAEAEQKLKEIIDQVREQHVRIDPQEIARRMTEQRQAMARMISWLDQCPAPPRRPPGHAR